MQLLECKGDRPCHVWMSPSRQSQLAVTSSRQQHPFQPVTAGCHPPRLTAVVPDCSALPHPQTCSGTPGNSTSAAATHCKLTDITLQTNRHHIANQQTSHCKPTDITFQTNRDHIATNRMQRVLCLQSL